MATSKLVENGDSNNNTYHVDGTGRMVASGWVRLGDEDYYDGAGDNEPEAVWYYFQNSGKVCKTSDKISLETIDGKKYASDESGHMLQGRAGKTSDRCSGDIGYQTGIHYCGAANGGVRASGDWRYPYAGTENRRDDNKDDTPQFYFDISGKKVYTDEDCINDKTPSDDVFKIKKINGKTCVSDIEDRVINKWSVSTVVIASNISGYLSTSGDGTKKKGWFQAVLSASVNPTANSDDEAKWFYANNDDSLVYDAIKTVNSKKYAFNEKGEMLSGLWALKVDNNVVEDYYEFTEAATVDCIDSKVPTGWDVYYFGDGEDGVVKTGTQAVEVDGERYQFVFGKSGASKGRGVDALQGNTLYSYGKRTKVDDDYRYQVFEADGEAVLTVVEGSAVTTDGYSANASGSIMRGSGLYTDSDGRQSRITKNPGLDTYTVTYENTKNQFQVN